HRDGRLAGEGTPVARGAHHRVLDGRQPARALPAGRVHQALQSLPAHETHHAAQHPRLPETPAARGRGSRRCRRACAIGAAADARGGSARPRLSTPRTTLVVVGSGVAGLSVALAAAPRPVIVLARAPRGGDSASALAQGGIAAAIGPGDSAAAHARDTLEAGAFLNDAAAVWLLVRHAPAAIARLQALGVGLDRSG